MELTNSCAVESSGKLLSIPFEKSADELPVNRNESQSTQARRGGVFSFLMKVASKVKKPK